MGVVREYKRHSKRVTATKRWQVLRHQILERDNWECRECGDRTLLHVDHVKPVKTHPEIAFEPGNLQTLCYRCHSAKTRKEVGWPPVHQSPAHDAWKQAVADLAAGNATAMR